MMGHPRRHGLRSPGAGRQGGVALIVGLIMLVIITLVIVAAYSLTSSNAKAVGNVQARAEAIASANQVIERQVATNFTVATGTQTFNVDINLDGVNDYAVVVPPPTCIRAVKASSAKPSDVELPPEMSSGVDWLTDWNIDAAASNAATGAAVQVRQGVRVMLSQTQKDAVCP